jgi:hypothetical protein
MSFTGVGVIDHQIKSFFSPRDLLKFECVSKTNISTTDQWKKLGYDDKNDFKKTVYNLMEEGSGNSQDVIKEFLLIGYINGKQAKEILKQGVIGKPWCCCLEGIQAIALGIFSPSEVGAMNTEKRMNCLTKNGFELTKKRFIINSNLETEKDTKKLLGSIIKKEKMLEMTLAKLDKISREEKKV